MSCCHFQLSMWKTWSLVCPGHSPLLNGLLLEMVAITQVLERLLSLHLSLTACSVSVNWWIAKLSASLLYQQVLADSGLVPELEIRDEQRERCCPTRKEERRSAYSLPRKGKYAEHQGAQGRSLQLPGVRVAVSTLSRFCRGVRKEPKEEDAIVEKGPKEKDGKRNNIWGRKNLKTWPAAFVERVKQFEFDTIGRPSPLHFAPLPLPSTLHRRTHLGYLSCLRAIKGICPVCPGYPIYWHPVVHSTLL